MDSKIEISEKTEIVDHYTQQLVNSGYACDQIRDIIESSLKGVIRKENRRKMTERRYKSAEETLGERNVRKLTEATTWYRGNDKESDEALNEKKEKDSPWTKWRKGNKKRKRNKGSIDVEGKSKLMSVLFVQHTPKSELAKRIRMKLENFEKLGSLKFKVVEKTGMKIEEILHKSNAWSDQKCGRNDCLLCNSAGEDERKGLCKRRNIVYETFCMTCHEKEKRKKEEGEIYMITCEEINNEIKGNENPQRKRKRVEDGGKERKRIEKKVDSREYRVKYVGETGRSAYERGLEHINDYMNYDEGSHLLKHYLNCHKEMKMCDVKFGMRIRNTFNTALERQVGEAVAIDIENRRGIKIMNSKSEYNRCTIPRISTKSVKEANEENEKELEEERNVKNEIRRMKMMK